MNNKNFLLVILGIISFSVQADHTASSICACSHSFFSIRPPFQNSTPENITLFYTDAALRRDCGWNGAIQVVGFGGSSTRSKDLARFFTPNCSDSLIFAGTLFDDVTTNPNARDVNSRFFGITPNDFASLVTFKPHQTYAGVGFAWKQYLGWCNPCPRWWFEVSFPVVHVKNNMRLTESIINQGTVLPGSPANVTEAFTGLFPLFISSEGIGTHLTDAGMQFGRIDGSRKKTGVADFEFKLGYDFIMNECCHLDGYFGLVAPTGNRPKARYVFEPIVGNNHHWGFMWGSSYGGIIWEGCNMDLRLEIAMNGRYLFKNTQTRSFDVNGKPWSRYMLVFTSGEAAVVPTPAGQTARFGINFFTQKLHVKPGAQQHINTGLVFDWCNFEAELGYHLWAAQCERVKLKNPFPTGLAFVGLTAGDTTIDLTVDGMNLNAINRAITIKENFQTAIVAYATPLTIVESDLNLGSAAMPCALTHAIYGSLGYNADWCWPLFFGIGGSYELTPKRVNTALNRWMVWGKIGVSI